MNMEHVISLGSLGRFSDDEDSCSSSSSDDASLKMVPRQGAIPPAPGRFGRQSEAVDWTEEELAERSAVWSRLSPGTRDALQRNDLAFLRLVRGYWKYNRRTETIATVSNRWLGPPRKSFIHWRQRLPFDEGFHRHVWPSWVLGHDRYGHPVVLERLAALDWDRALQLSTYDLVQMRVQSLEALQAECARLSLQSGCRVYKVLYIVDVGDASSWTLMNSKVIEFAKLYAKVLEQLFADAAWMNLVVNAPTIARATWSIIERVVDEETRAIVRFLPVGESCFDALRDAGVPSEIIPSHLGGSAPMGTLVADLIDKHLDAHAKEAWGEQESASQRVQSDCDVDDSENVHLNRTPALAEFQTGLNLSEKPSQSCSSSDCTHIPWHMLILRAPERLGASHLAQTLACMLWVIARPFIIALTQFVGLIRATRLLFNTPSGS